MDYLNNLGRISEEMRSARGYQFAPLRPVLISKGNRKYRLICIPTVRDRIVQKSIQAVLQKNVRSKYWKFNGISYGFVKGKSVGSAIQKALRLRDAHPYVYKTDITSFFDNIDRARLKEEVNKKIPNTSLHTLLFNAIDCEILDANSSKKHYLQKTGMQPFQGVRQGMPLSPLFANFYLCDFDDLIKKKGLNCIRYADDLIFFSDSEEKCEQIHTFCKTHLHSFGLEIPEPGDQASKTQIVSPSNQIEFLGMSIVRNGDGKYVAEIPEKQRKIIREALFQFADINYLSRTKTTIKNYTQKLISTVHGYEAAYEECDGFKDFQICLKQWAGNAMRHLMLKEFKIKHHKLSEEQKRFLSIDLT